MTFLDLFAGVGGFRRGMELAGHKCIGFCEWDKYARMSYISMHCITEEQRAFLATLDIKERQKEILKEKYLNGEWCSDDIRAVDAGNIPKADCWCFGAPCQDFSLAGKRKGLEGDRSSLIREVFRILGEIREEDKPEWLIYENVKGMLSSNRGFDYLSILLEFWWGGTISNGRYSTLNCTEYLKTGSVSILLDILEDVVPEKYFLSRQQMEKIVLRE